MIQLFFLETDESADCQMFETLLPLVSKARRSELGRMRVESDRKARLLADILLRCKACEYLKASNDLLIFGKNACGKPYLRDFSGFHFNISHTKSAAAAAISDFPIGVDVERMRAADPRVIRHAFTEGETAYVNSETPGTDRRFIEVWTRKESLVKWTGDGLAADLIHADVISGEYAPMIKTVYSGQYTISLCSELLAMNPDAFQGTVYIGEQELLEAAGHLGPPCRDQSPYD